MTQDIVARLRELAEIDQRRPTDTLMKGWRTVRVGLLIEAADLIDRLSSPAGDVVERVARAIDPELWQKIDAWHENAERHREAGYEGGDQVIALELANDCDRKANKNAAASLDRARAALSALPPEPNQMREALTQCAEWFREYERAHLEYADKAPDDDAILMLDRLRGAFTHGQMATMCEAALSSPPQASRDSVLVDALRKFDAEFEGSFVAFDFAIREVISNTNYNIIAERWQAVKQALSSRPPDPAQASPLVEFFRGAGFDDFGDAGDYHMWSTEQTAVHFLTEYLKVLHPPELRAQPYRPGDVGHGGGGIG